METVIYAIVMMVASYLITYATMGKQVGPTPAAFEDVDVPQVDDGTPISVVFGDVWIEDWAVLAMGNFRATAIKDKMSAKK